MRVTDCRFLPNTVFFSVAGHACEWHSLYPFPESRVTVRNTRGGFVFSTDDSAAIREQLDGLYAKHCRDKLRDVATNVPDYLGDQLIYVANAETDKIVVDIVQRFMR